MKLKAGGKAVIVAGLVSLIGIGINSAMKNNYFNSKALVGSSVPDRIDYPQGNTVQAKTVSQVDITPVSTNYELKVLTIPWNATQGLLFANGDSTTSRGSLMDQRGLKVRIERQDDYSKMLTDQIAFAEQISQGVKNPTKRAAFVIIMGDGYPAYIYGAQEALSKINQQLEVVGALGYSRGEDKCVIDKQANPKGSLIAAVLRDGDWNICVKYASDNGIKINPDEATYDAEAMNFVSVNAFTDADDKFIAGYCENRANTKTGIKEKRCVNGSATWTPGDVKLLRKRGNFKVLASTKEYQWQMPAIIIGNRQWMSQNSDIVENFLSAAFEGGERVRMNDQDLQKASGIASKVFNEENAAYWAKYFKGVTEDSIPLGGSTTIGLSDNAYLFGLNGNYNLYKSVYNVFGNIAAKFYPSVMSSVFPYQKVVNTLYLESLLSKSKNLPQPEKPSYTFQDKVSGTFASKSYSIEFDFNKSTFTPKARAVLEDMLNQLSVSGLTIQINGHTDSVGSSDANLVLSRKRAEAVKNWIMANAQSAFPNERIRVRGYGDTAPIADNRTPNGQAQNRRVEIQLLSTQGVIYENAKS